MGGEHLDRQFERERRNIDAKPRVVKFRDGEFLPLVGKLYETYPDEWVALEIGECDERSGLRRGKIVAHHPTSREALKALATFRHEHPTAAIRLFNTRLARM